MARTIWHHNKHPLHCHTGMCNSMPPPYLDVDGGTTATQIIVVFYVKICFFY